MSFPILRRGAALYALVLALSLAARCAPQPALTLAENGKSDYVIVVAPDAVEAPQAAALELQSYLEKVTGAKLPIVNAPPAAAPAIFVGESAWAKKRGVDVSKFGAEEFAIKTAGRDLVLAGRDEAGDPWHMGWDKTWSTPTLFAVDTFLERFAGVHWFWPGALGEEAPRRAKLEIGALALRESPAFASRVMTGDTDNTDIAHWLVRNRLGEVPKVVVWHNWWRILPESKYLKDHPEYFALVNGKRGVGDGATGYVWGHQVCTTNEDVRRIFIQEAIAYFDKNPQAQTFSISPNDGNGQCECDVCRALDVEKNPDGTPVPTDRMMAFYNAVARGVAKKYPHKFLGAYIYNEYSKPNNRIHVEPNLMLRDVYNYAGNLLWDASYRSATYDRIAKWRAITPNIALTSYYYYDTFTGLNLPLASSEVLPDFFRFIKSSGGRGAFFSTQKAAIGDQYLAAQLLWNPNADANAILTDYYDGLFGAQAGPLVRRYHALIQSQMRVLATQIMQRSGTEFETDPVNGNLSAALAVYRPIRAQADALFSQADALALTASQKARLDAVQKNWRYTELTIDAVDAIDKMNAEVKAHPAQPASSVIIAARAAIEARSHFMDAVAATDPSGLIIGNARAYEKTATSTIPFEPALGRIRGLLAGQKRTAHARAIAGDKPTDGDWKTAPALENFVEAFTGAPAKLTTTGRVLYNRRALFIRVECEEPEIEKIWNSGITARDGSVWQDNSIDVFLDPDNARQQYFHLITNPRGAQFDAKEAVVKDKTTPEVNAAWNGEWSVATQKTATGWSAVFEIPFATLGTEAPLKGDVWGFNLAHVRPASKEYSAWSPTFGGFQNPQMFGQLAFE